MGNDSSKQTLANSSRRSLHQPALAFPDFGSNSQAYYNYLSSSEIQSSHKDELGSDSYHEMAILQALQFLYDPDPDISSQPDLIEAAEELLRFFFVEFYPWLFRFNNHVKDIDDYSKREGDIYVLEEHVALPCAIVHYMSMISKSFRVLRDRQKAKLLRDGQVQLVIAVYAGAEAELKGLVRNQNIRDAWAAWDALVLASNVCRRNFFLLNHLLVSGGFRSERMENAMLGYLREERVCKELVEGIRVASDKGLGTFQVTNYLELLMYSDKEQL
ncbi:hypothetical protein BJ508DRAFT_301980 [Ascobolus immersus RN42]|uniref:Uncharacterized protein n=1 Tax=Ascobolus immersus RN42 TaxID=1160509 RepID=A0A3N4IQW7_ASCIM|nr:hypothetical protein BJ508DRAFT_301980 [Ascobolus immersus RN42]